MKVLLERAQFLNDCKSLIYCPLADGTKMEKLDFIVKVLFFIKIMKHGKFFIKIFAVKLFFIIHKILLF